MTAQDGSQAEEVAGTSMPGSSAVDGSFKDAREDPMGSSEGQDHQTRAALLRRNSSTAEPLAASISTRGWENMGDASISAEGAPRPGSAPGPPNQPHSSFHPPSKITKPGGPGRISTGGVVTQPVGGELRDMSSAEEQSLAYPPCFPATTTTAMIPKAHDEDQMESD
jgi:hypothetical protein